MVSTIFTTENYSHQRNFVELNKDFSNLQIWFDSIKLKLLSFSFSVSTAFGQDSQFGFAWSTSPGLLENHDPCNSFKFERFLWSLAIGESEAIIRLNGADRLEGSVWDTVGYINTHFSNEIFTVKTFESFEETPKSAGLNVLLFADAW